MKDRAKRAHRTNFQYIRFNQNSFIILIFLASKMGIGPILSGKTVSENLSPKMVFNNFPDLKFERHFSHFIVNWLCTIKLNKFLSCKTQKLLYFIRLKCYIIVI